MSEEFCDKLRLEIREGLKRCHEFKLKKLAFGSSLLGIGSLVVPYGSMRDLDLSPLLYLVPVIAVAYDFFIVAEDFNIKRAGEFLSRDESGSCKEEKSYENYLNNHVNKFDPIAFFLVTLSFLTGSVALLFQIDSSRGLSISILIILTFVIESILLIYTLNLRKQLSIK